MDSDQSAHALITAALPLLIRGLEVTDPVLTLFGDGWSLNLMCPWNVVATGFATSWLSADLEDEVWELIGQSIIGVTSGSEAIDPIFHLSGGGDLVLHADTDLDPWSLMLPDVTIVGRRTP